MKRFMCLVLAFMAMAAPLTFSSEETEVYRQIYRDAGSLQQKYSAVLSLVGLGDRSVAPILSEALDDLLLRQSSYSSGTDKEIYADMVKVLCRALGDYKYDDSAASLWAVVQQLRDPLARAEALISLGKVHATDYVERIAIMLRDLDMVPGQLADEQVAYGCILALEKFRDVRGFMPVFYATDAWYTQRVRDQAERSLANIAADPTDPIMELIRKESAQRKLLALKYNAASKAPVERKIQAALLALDVAESAGPRDKTEAKAFSEVRKLALRSLIAWRSTKPEGVPLAVFAYSNGFDDEERLLALQSLGVNATDAAATALRDIILRLDADQKAGITDDTRNRMAKAAIENGALTKNHILWAALMAVSSNEKWSGGILLAAQTALKEIP
jgi:hypothetical protein